LGLGALIMSNDSAAFFEDLAAERFRPGPWAFGLVALCAAPLILWLFGVDFSTHTVPLTLEGIREFSKPHGFESETTPRAFG